MYCVLCGTENPDFARFCRKCGETIYQEASEPPSPLHVENGSRVPYSAVPVAIVSAVPDPGDTLSERKSIESPDSETNQTVPIADGDVLQQPTEIPSPVEPSSEVPIIPDVTEYASWEGRLLAYILDLGVIYFVIFGLYLVSGLMGALGKGFLSSDASEINLVFWIVLPTYMVASLMFTHTTVGKYSLGMEVVSDSGERNRYPSFWRTLLRETFGRIISSLFFGMGYWRIGGAPEHQAWSDQIADTVVRYRPANKSLKRALQAFAVIALLLDVVLMFYGNWSQDRAKRHQEWEDEITRASTSVQSARQSIDEILGRQSADLLHLQSDMTELEPALNTYDERLDSIKETLRRGQRDNLFESDAERHQVAVMFEVFDLRKKAVAKQRQEADLVIAFNPSTGKSSDLQSDLRLLDSDIEGLNQKASQKMAEIGLK